MPKMGILLRETRNWDKTTTSYQTLDAALFYKSGSSWVQYMQGRSNSNSTAGWYSSTKSISSSLDTITGTSSADKAVFLEANEETIFFSGGSVYTSGANFNAGDKFRWFLWG